MTQRRFDIMVSQTSTQRRFNAAYLIGHSVYAILTYPQVEKEQFILNMKTKQTILERFRCSYSTKSTLSQRKNARWAPARRWINVKYPMGLFYIQQQSWHALIWNKNKIFVVLCTYLTLGQHWINVESTCCHVNVDPTLTQRRVSYLTSWIHQLDIPSNRTSKTYWT